jgi:hypothetical protein
MKSSQGNSVIPAEAGIQSPTFWIPARASYRQLGRNDGTKRICIKGTAEPC